MKMRIHNTERRMKTPGSTMLKCVVVGDDKAGKTSMIASYVTGSILGERVPTVFDTFNVYEDHQQGVDNTCLPRPLGTAFSVVDTANQDEYEQRINHYADCDVIMMCFPVISRQLADGIRTRWLAEFEKYAPSVPILLVGTKADLRVDPETIESQGLQSIMTKDEGYALAKNLGTQGYVECSAIEHVGLENVFEKAREVAKFGYIRGLSKNLSRKRGHRERASSFFKYFVCGKPTKDGSRVR